MSSIIDQFAYDAIEEWVMVNHPNATNAWLQIVPSNAPWQYPQDAWQVAAGAIIVSFNAKLSAGKNVTVTPSVREKYRSEPLRTFRRYLAIKAEAVRSTEAARLMEA
jgi:hypothetical protein